MIQDCTGEGVIQDCTGEVGKHKEYEPCPLEVIRCRLQLTKLTRFAETSFCTGANAQGCTRPSIRQGR